MKNFLSIFCVALSIVTAAAQTPILIKDLNPSAGSACESHHYKSDYFVQMKNGKIFFPTCPFDGFAYVTDGSSAGTTWLNAPNLQLNTGANQYQVYDPTTDKIFFSGRGASFAEPDIELWTTDGTVAGTSKVKDIGAGTASAGVEYLTAHKGKIYFSCSVGSNSGFWVSDGTAAGTLKIKAATNLVIKNIKSIDGKLYFLQSQSGSTFDYDLWESDGTAAGTKKALSTTSTQGTVQDFVVTPLGFYVTTRAFGNKELKLLNTTTKTLTPLYNGAKGDAGLPLHFKGKDYFIAKNWDGNQELYTTDATEAGTKSMVAFTSSYPFGQNFMVAESFFAFAGKTDNAGAELWVSDGTVAGTKLIDLNKGKENSTPGDFCRVGNTIYFAADVTDAAGKLLGRELMQTDGTAAGTKLVADIYPGTDNSSPTLLQMVNIGGKPNLIFFAANDKTNGAEPYRLEVKVITDTKDANFSNDLLIIAPNPTENEIRINIKEGENLNIILFDANGKQIINKNNVSSSTSIDLTFLPKGLYILKAQAKNASYQVVKVVKN
jgi:ELWxxDGT repeat protein